MFTSPEILTKYNYETQDEIAQKEKEELLRSKKLIEERIDELNSKLKIKEKEGKIF